MDSHTFFIKSLAIQNTIMLFALFVVVILLVWSVAKKKPRHLLASLLWLFIVFWFFNSAFFGFSAVSVDAAGIHLDYGVLSFRDASFPIDTPWKIETRFSGLRKMKRVHLIQIGDRESMKVRGQKDLNLLKEIGSAIEEMKR